MQFGPNASHRRVHIVSHRGRHGSQDIEVGQVKARSAANLADFTNDGIGDIAFTNNGSGTLGVNVGLGSGEFSQGIELSVPPGPLALTTTDLNGDGLPDAALTAHSGSNNFVTVLLDPSSFANGGSSSQFPYPGSEFIDLGLKVKATPASRIACSVAQ